MYPETLRKNTKYLSHNSQRPGQDTNRAPSEYKFCRRLCSFVNLIGFNKLDILCSFQILGRNSFIRSEHSDWNYRCSSYIHQSEYEIPHTSLLWTN
jgi:hypothetical protein